jgi:hypothetical protein
MFDKPTLILPLPDGFRSHHGVHPLVAMMFLLFAAFIYYDVTRGGVKLPDELQKKFKKTEMNKDSAKAKSTSYAYGTQSYFLEGKPQNTQVDVDRVEPTVAPQEMQVVTTPQYTYYDVITDDTKIRSSSQRTSTNATGMLDLHEKVIYQNQSPFTETFSRADGEEVTDYWYYVYRIKTGQFGWIHGINLQRLN